MRIKATAVSLTVGLNTEAKDVSDVCGRTKKEGNLVATRGYVCHVPLNNILWSTVLR